MLGDRVAHGDVISNETGSQTNSNMIHAHGVNNTMLPNPNHHQPYRTTHRHQPPSTHFTPRAASAGGAGIPQNSNGNASSLGHNLLAIEQAEQSRLLALALKRVEEQAYYMKYVMDDSGSGRHGNVFAAVMDYAFMMLEELSTSSLIPKYYYELYLKVVDELQVLEEFFVGLCEDSLITAQKLYEVVQYAPKAVPRLYLQVTAGSAYVKFSQGSAAKEVWSDLITGIKCVQCPLRGLFLRAYLSHASKDKLFIDVDNKEEGVLANDAYSFLMENFVETTKLWVRIQHLGGSNTKEIRKRREKERIELRVLVGANLVTLSQMDSLTVMTYKERILPQILEQILLFKDTLAQGYLMDCLVHAFPNEFHMETLEFILSTMPKLKEKVNVHNILQSIMTRLTDHISSLNIQMPPDFFKLFSDCIEKILEDKIRLPIKEVVRIQIALLNFTIKSYPDNMDHIDYCITSSLSILVKKNSSNAFDSGAVNEICNLLTVPLEILGLKVLDLDGFSGILNLLPWNYQRQIALAFLKSVCESGIMLSNLSHAEKLFDTIKPLLKENSTSSVLGLEDAYVKSSSFQHDQHYVSKVIHILENSDTDVLFKMYNIARKSFGDVDIERINFTLVPLVYAVVSLIYKVHAIEFHSSKIQSQNKPNDVESSIEEGSIEGKIVAENHVDGEESKDGCSSSTGQQNVNVDKIVQHQFNKSTSCRKLLVFLQKLVASVAMKNAELGFKLYLECALVADRCAFINIENKVTSKSCDFNGIAYEFMAQAFLLYEDEITDSKVQYRSITSIVGTLIATRSFVNADYESLATKATQYAAKLVKKPDQCKMIILCSHLFYRGNEGDFNYFHNSQRVLECLQRALKLADACMSTASNLGLFVDILDTYLYFFERKCPVITDKFVSGLIALINEHIDNIQDFSDSTIAAQAHFNQIIRYINRKKNSPETAVAFMPIMSG